MRRHALSIALASAVMFSPVAAIADDAAPMPAGNKPALAANTGKKPVTDREQFAYSIGYLSGQNSAEHISDLDVDTYFRAFRDAFDKKESLLSAQERTTAINRYKEQRLAQLQADLAKLAADNAAAGADFLAANAKADGVQTTDSGLQYRVISTGTGPKPKAKDTVRVNYEGRFIDGTVFDSSYNRGEPALLQLDQVLPGWTEGLQLMNVGSTYELFLPSALAYGEAGANPVVPPNAVLIFKVELLGIEKAPSTGASKGKSKKKK